MADIAYIALGLALLLLCVLTLRWARISEPYRHALGDSRAGADTPPAPRDDDVAASTTAGGR